MNSIVKFIEDRLDEDENNAQGASALTTGQPVSGAEWSVTEVPFEGITVWDPQPDLPGHTDARTEHIARHDPARVLREVEGKRAIVEECASILDVGGWEYEDAPNLAWLTLCGLAAAWTDHPDFDQDWAFVSVEDGDS